MSIENYIEKLSGLNGISGHEQNIAYYLKNHLLSLGLSVDIDNLGNVIACKKSKAGNGKVMLEAHIDEIGFVVKSIDEDGFLILCPVGGIDSRIMCGNTVTVQGKNKTYTGVVGAMPPHMTSEEERNTVVSFDKMYVDVGMSKDESEVNIGIGACVMFDSSCIKLNNGYIAAKAMDDRAAASILLECCERLLDAELDYDLYFCFCVQEEVGLRGSLTAAYNVNPDMAIAIDVTHATTPDESKGTFKCGCGPVVCKGPNIHSTLVSRFIDLLKKESISYEIEVEGGNTGTDAWSIQTTREGIPTMLLSLPLKYMHTPIETLTVEDCNICCDALSKFLTSFKKVGDVLC